MDAIFINSENSKTSKPHVLMLKLSDELDWRRGQKSMLYQILVFTMHGKTQKAHTITINLKYQLQHGMINLNYLMGHILYQIFKAILSTFKKSIMKKLIIHQ